MRRRQLIMIVMSVCIGIVGLLDVGRLARAQSGTPTPKTLVVTTLKISGPGSITEAVAQAEDGDTVTFASQLSGSIEPDLVAQIGQVLITKNLTILGPEKRDININVIIGNNTYPRIVGKLVFRNMALPVIVARGDITIENCIISSGILIFGNARVLNSQIGNTSPDDVIRTRLGVGPSPEEKLESNLYVYGSTFIGGEFAIGAENATIVNSTFANQTAAVFDVALHIEVINSTFAIGGPGARFAQIAGKFPSIGNYAITLRNSIITNYPQPDLRDAALTDRMDYIFTLCDYRWTDIVVDGGGNIQYPVNNCGKSIPVADPKLGPLQDNGGPTPTFTLRPGSAAIGHATDCPAADQRGLKLPATKTTGCDSGAYQTGAR
jgi:hypothetical protein